MAELDAGYYSPFGLAWVKRLGKVIDRFVDDTSVQVPILPLPPVSYTLRCRLVAPGHVALHRNKKQRNKGT